ncbi:hypothetical protein KEM48_002291 [Puccinia striiformis f. sp. tritici PST-130]|nr:hypothetical protein KEM48_002291 [Puccinia striiformis f. sp. tritici PST-130]
MDVFVKTCWDMLTKLGRHQRSDILVSKATCFLSVVVKMPSQKSLLESAETLEAICEKIGLLNMFLRKGLDNDTCRQAAIEITQALLEQFQEQVTAIITRYVHNYLQQYAADPAGNWHLKDAAVFLLASIASRSSTTAGGVTNTDSLMDVVQFFSEHNREEELEDISCLQVNGQSRYEIPELIKRIDSHYSQLSLIDDILKAFRIAAAELPHLALLISFLSIPGPPSNEATKQDESIPTTPSIGLQIIRDLALSSQSLLALLRAIFSATTDELTCTGARANECLRIVCKGLLRSNLLKMEDEDLPKDVNELVESIRVHMVVNCRLDRSLFNEPDCLSQYINPIEELVAALEGAD